MLSFLWLWYSGFSYDHDFFLTIMIIMINFIIFIFTMMILRVLFVEFY